MKKRVRKFRLKIDEYNMRSDDRLHIMDAHKHMKNLHSIKLKKDDGKLIKIAKNTISPIRSELNNEYAQKFWNVTVMLGPHKHEELFPYYPKHEDVLYVRNNLVEKLSEGRKKKKEMHNVVKEFNGFEYNMMAPSGDVPANSSSVFAGFGGGAVFEKSNTILELANSESYKRRIRKAKKPYDKANYVGVELELINKVPRERLEELFVAAKLSGSVYVKGDSSIRAEGAGDYTHEVTLIAKEDNIYNIINRVCEVLNSKEVGSYVNNSCGLHVHLDMRHRDIDKSYRNFYYSLPVLSGMVPHLRTKGDSGTRFCAQNNTVDWKESSRNRYTAINSAAYSSHRTLELRLHSGSTNALKINMWIELLLAIVNHPVKMSSMLDTVHALRNVLTLSDKLVDYVVRRTEKFTKDASFDTRKDHFELTA